MEKNNNTNFDISAIFERLENLEKENKSLRSEVQQLKDNDVEIKAEIQTINKFISAMTESQSIDEVMTEIESAAKQLTGSDNVTFYCMDSTNKKFFSENEGRQWNPKDTEDIKTVFNTQIIKNFGNMALIPLVTSSGNSLGVLKADKKSCFDSSDLKRYFAKGGTFIENIQLGLLKEYEHQGRITDELTQMYNRQGLNEYLVNTVVRAHNEGKCVNLLMSDIDHFKNVNDTFGHDAGDEILKTVANVLKDFTKDSESSCFRLGGEEMMMILITDTPEEAIEAAEQIRRQTEAKRTEVKKDGEALFIGVTVSIGVHEFSPDVPLTKENARKVFDEQFKIADEAAYKAKQSGRNQVVCADSLTYINYLADKSADIFIASEKISNEEAMTTIYDMVHAAFEAPTEEQNIFTVVEALREYADTDNQEIAEMAAFIADKAEALANEIEAALAELSPKSKPQENETAMPEEKSEEKPQEQEEQTETKQNVPKKHISDVTAEIREWTTETKNKLAEQEEQQREQFNNFYGSDGDR